MSDFAAPAEIVAGSPPRTAAPAAGRGFAHVLTGMKAVTAQPAVAKSLPLLALVGIVGVAALLWLAISAPPARSLFSGLPDADKAAVAEALDGAAIAYEIDRATGAIAVSDADYHRARMLLASQGLPKSAPDGGEVLGNLPLGASRAVETERLRTAKEVDLARTIEAIDAVQSARVHLAVEAPSVFLRDRTRRAASVMLRLNPGRSLGDAQVQAIVHLVASSVPGLAPEGVSVVDQSGRLLSSGDGEAGAASDRQVAIQAKIEERYARALDALLTPIVGAGNFTAEVHADVDFSEVQATREGFPQDASTISREERAWTAAAAKEEEAAGIPGTMSNQAPTATEVAAAPGAKIDPKAAGADAAGETAGKVQENYTRNFAIGREVSVTRKPTGEVKRLTVAVAIRNPEGGTRSKQELARIEALVKGAVGYSAGRGDVVALDALSFADAEAFEENWWDAEWVSMLARNVAGLGVAALLIFAVVLPMLRRTGLIGGKGAAAPAARPAAGASAGPAAPSPAAAREMASMMQEAAADPLDQTLRLFETAHSYEARAVLIRDFVRQNPERAALAVRDLLRTDKNDGGDRHG